MDGFYSYNNRMSKYSDNKSNWIMEGWMHGWVDGWWMDEWMDEQIDDRIFYYKHVTQYQTTTDIEVHNV